MENLTAVKKICLYDVIFEIKKNTDILNLLNSELYSNIDSLDHKDNINEYYSKFKQMKVVFDTIESRLINLIAIEKISKEYTSKSLFKPSSKMKNPPRYIYESAGFAA